MIDIRVIIPYGGGPDGPAMLATCLRSVARQDYSHVVGVLVDDATGPWAGVADTPYHAEWMAATAVAGWVSNSERRGELACIEAATRAMLEWGKHPDQTGFPVLTDDTVIVHVCGDDYLPAADVLTRLAAVYEDPDVWLTYGGYAFEDGQPGHCQPYPPEAHAAGDYRARPWQASHLRSYRCGLWRQIPPEQLIDPSTGGTWLYATDRAMMLPMLEMAREHARFTPCEPPLYTYRRHPGNVPNFMDAGHCERVAAMPRLKRIDTIYGAGA